MSNGQVNISYRKYRTDFYLVLIFIISIIIRLPYLNRPLSLHHEELTAHALIPLQIWHEEGALKYKFCPVLNYSNKADKIIISPNIMKDAQGNSCYTSMPPFGLILPYFLFKLLHIYPDVQSIQIFNLILHFTSAVFIYLIISLLTKRYYPLRTNIAAILGFSIYLFSAATLWFQSNVYFSDTLAQPIFIIGICLFLKLMTGEQKKLIYYLSLGLVNFCLIYTDWIGILFTFSVFVYTLINFKKKEMRIVLYIITLTSLASLLLIIWQYSQIAGFHEYINWVVKKYFYRSGMAHTGHHYLKLRSYENILYHYLNNYLPLIIIIYTFIWLLFIQYNNPLTKDLFKKNKNEITILYLCSAPVVLHHLLLFDYTSVHDLSVLKTSVLIAISIALLYNRLVNMLQINNPDRSKKTKVTILNLFVILMIIGSILQYMLINRKGDESFKNIGEKIAEVQKNNEVVFIKMDNYKKDGWRGGLGCPLKIAFYAHRNIAAWEGDLKARELLELTGVERGVIFVLNQENSQVINIAYINR